MFRDSWKIFLGVSAALLLAGSCAVGGCLFLIGAGAAGVARAQQERDECIRKMVVGDLSWSDERNYTYVRGNVTNFCGRTVNYWKLSVRFLDASGAVIDSDYTNSGETLRHGESKRFEIMHPRSRIATAARFTAVVEEVSFAQ